jgi:uncharacterized membrane protein YraQ (UPF0718 family)
MHCLFPNIYLYLTLGEKLVNFMVEPKKGTRWPKELPKFTSRQEAIGVCKDLCSGHFMHRSEKVGKGELEVSCLVIFYLFYGVIVLGLFYVLIRQQFIESPIGTLPFSNLVLLAA